MGTSDTQVVVTGLGATTPLGGDVSATWEALLAGKSGVGPLNEPWAEKVPIHIVARLAEEPTERIERVQARRLDRVQQVALVAAREAWADAGAPDLDRTRLAVAIGTGIGGALTLLGQHDLLNEKGSRSVSPLTVPMLMPNGPAAIVGIELQAQAGVHSTVSACASGAEAIALALDLIRAGRADVVVTGGAEACVHPLPMAGFAQARTMSTRNDDPQRASRPFDKDRDGFVLGEGAGVLVLERAEFAKARGAKIYATLAGAGITSDGHHIAQPHPEGTHVRRAMRMALQSAGLDIEQINHINAHATSTPVGDAAEALAIRSEIGTHPVVTAPKGTFGHLLGAAGAVESIATVLSIHNRVVPPTINLDQMDEGINLDVATEPRELAISGALNNSFGFGGHNVSLAFTPATQRV